MLLMNEDDVNAEPSDDVPSDVHLTPDTEKGRLAYSLILNLQNIAMAVEDAASDLIHNDFPIAYAKIVETHSRLSQIAQIVHGQAKEDVGAHLAAHGGDFTDSLLDYLRQAGVEVQILDGEGAGEPPSVDDAVDSVWGPIEKEFQRLKENEGLAPDDDEGSY